MNRQRTPFRKRLQVPGDKSISHRSILFGAIAEGTTKVTGFLPGNDCLCTIDCLQKLGVPIERTSKTEVTILGQGIQGLREPSDHLYVGNSGTTIRLMLGVLSGLPFATTIYGDESIARRPMDRVVRPLQQMGAQIVGKENGKYTPLKVNGQPLQAIHYDSPIASAQVKSALLLAGLQAKGRTTITEPALSRDHTERMLVAFGGAVSREAGNQVSIVGGQQLTGTMVRVPGDISSAAFLLSAALMVPGSQLTVDHVGLNPTRTGIVDVLRLMGAEVQVTETDQTGNESIGSITITGQELQGVEIGGDLIPRLIDEIPILAVVATQARGETVIRDAAELKVKESNRIATITQELRKLGADIEETADGLRIHGPTQLSGGFCDSHGDHRIGMSMMVAGLAASDPVKVAGEEVINVSFPHFQQYMEEITSR